MRILALLDDAGVERLRPALTGDDRVRAVRSGQALEMELGQYAFAVCVLDPILIKTGRFIALVTVLAERPGRCLFLTRLDADSASRVLLAAKQGLSDVSFIGSDDHPKLLRQRLERLATGYAPAMLLSRLAGALTLLPEPVQPAIVDLFADGALPGTVGALASRATVGRRKLHRWLGRAGIHSASKLIEAARVARSWNPLGKKSRSSSFLAEAGGLLDPRTLRANYARVLGVSPSEAARTLEATRLVDLLAMHVLSAGKP